MIFHKSENPPGTLETLGNTHLDFWKKHQTFASEAREVNFSLVVNMFYNKARHNFKMLRVFIIMFGCAHIHFISMIL